MKVIIFGATGGTGVQLVRTALTANHTVSVFIRGGKDTLNDYANQIEMFSGDVRDFAAVSSAVQDQDAVLVALGVVPGRTQHILSAGTANIVRSMEQHGVRRLIVETGAGLIEDKSQLPYVWRISTLLPPMRGMFKDKKLQEEVIISSKLDWTIVRPANLTNGPLAVDYEVGEQLRLSSSSTISRADVADFMVKQVTSKEWIGKAVLITNVSK